MLTRHYLIPFCLTGFIADALTTWWGVTNVPGMFEANIIPSKLMVTHGLLKVVIFITVIKLVAIASVLLAEKLLRSCKGFGRTEKLITWGMVGFLLIGWIPATNNFILILKGT